MKLDQYESVFRAAEKAPYEYAPVKVRRSLVITDLDAAGQARFVDTARSFLAVLGEGVEWEVLNTADLDGVVGLRDAVSALEPDLVYTYRCLGSDAYLWPYTLGEHLELLTQIVECPVLLVPHPRTERASSHALENLNVVMAVTNHLAGDHRLVNYAVAVTEPGGTLFLSHVEDDGVYERYLRAVSRIPEIDTDIAGERILAQLLEEASDYIESCRQVLADQGLSIGVEAVVTSGHRLAEYRKLIAEHEADLLVMNTKHEDQLAMHGLAYLLAVELRQIPLLLL